MLCCVVVCTARVKLQTKQFLDALKNDLLTCILADQYYPYDSIIDPAFYFGLSMSRIGADIRPELLIIFNDMAVRRFQLTMTNATQKFENALAKQDTSAQLLKDVTTTTADIEPTQQLLQYSPLAALYNDVATAFNEMRSIAGLAVAHRIRSCVADNMLQAARALADFA